LKLSGQIAESERRVYHIGTQTVLHRGLKIAAFCSSESGGSLQGTTTSPGHRAEPPQSYPFGPDMGAYYYPGDVKILPGAQLREKPLNGCGLGVQARLFCSRFSGDSSYGCHMSKVP